MKKYKQNRKLSSVTCNHCNNEFQKPTSEYNRNVKLGRKNYCSRKCAGAGCGNLQHVKNNYKISQHSRNRRDELTPFRYALAKIKRRFKKVDLSLQDLKEVWEKQGGYCPYSGLKLVLQTWKKEDCHSMFFASVDRIDSSKGYVKGNIQYVSRYLNFLKAELSHKETVEICGHIAKHFFLTFAKDQTISSPSINDKVPDALAGN